MAQRPDRDDERPTRTPSGREEGSTRVASGNDTLQPLPASTIDSSKQDATGKPLDPNATPRPKDASIGVGVPDVTPPPAGTPKPAEREGGAAGRGDAGRGDAGREGGDARSGDSRGGRRE